ncbi:hypothetical protein M758_1G077500 [Ceratodon purpureus]|uniref:EF-hand domain-containing protein n=1 Tax=Ceratodon purpureus TaxID=3225 RepID=A0A8T0J3N2_CERPU|nr:hypothetical protein KC19_1G079300 [Ceratodon purpureus]KAG0629113.1 hypothetical protein M758_1G077500 [Ceratodon purpureus]
MAASVKSDRGGQIEEASGMKRPAGGLGGEEVVSGLPESVVKDLVEAFKMFDRNGDGKISSKELGTVLRSLGENLSEVELEQMIRDVDADGDGEIDLQEFINLNSGARRGGVSLSGGEVSDAEALQSAFDVFDSDKDGFISAPELHRVLSSLGDDHVSMDDCRYMISCVDADGDERVDFKEFQKLMTGPLTGHLAH